MAEVVFVLIMIVTLVQWAGDTIARRLDHR
jgi:ABC-type methionine transport system permease subunit